MELGSFPIAKDIAGQRLDRFLLGKFPDGTFGGIQKFIRSRDVLVNGAKVPINYVLRDGDMVTLSDFALRVLGSSAMHSRARTKVVKPKPKISDGDVAALKNAILYRDDNIIAINKPSGLAVQGGSKISKSLDAMLPYLRLGSAENPKLVHRLDRDTSGLMLIARSAPAAEYLSEVFRGRDIKKEYLAVVVGKLPKSSGEINLPLSKDLVDGVEKVHINRADGRSAITQYRVLGYYPEMDISLLLVRILTGRTHQIRVHLSHMGFPIVGDGKYGGRKARVEGLDGGMLLHSYALSFRNIDGKKLNLTAEPPSQMARVMDKFGDLSIKLKVKK